MAELSVGSDFTSINPATVNQAAANKPDNELNQSDFIELLVAQ